MKSIFKISILFLIYFCISKTLFSQDTIKDTSSVITYVKNDTIQYNINLFQVNPLAETTTEKYIPLILLALISGLIALYNIRSNTILSAKMIWIENLRDAISIYCTETLNVFIVVENIVDNGRKAMTSEYEGYLEDYNEYSALYTKSNILATKIKLYLNFSEEEKKIDTIIDKIKDKLNFQQNVKVDIKEIENDLDDLVKNAKLVIEFNSKKFNISHKTKRN